MDIDTSDYGTKFEVKKSNVKITKNENVEIVFMDIFVKSGSIYIKRRPQ